METTGLHSSKPAADPASTDTAGTSLNADESQLDLFCLECGYNLRGLSGDPRRCPECGYLNPMGDLEIPARFIRQQLRKMERSPAFCAGAVSLALGSVAVVGLMAAFIPGFELQGLLAVLPGLVSLVIWKPHAQEFCASCLGQPGWRRALWLYHLNSVPLCVVVMVMIAASCALPSYAGPSVRRNMDQISIFGLLSTVVVMAVGGAWAHRRIRKLLEPLQREVAVRLAREQVRRTLRKQGGARV